MRPRFDEFGSEDPDAEGEDPCGSVDGKGLHRPQGVEHGRVVKQGEVDKGGEVDGVDAPRLGYPGPGREEAARVAAPGRARPSHALGQVFGVLSESGLDACVLGILNFDLPSVIHHPARDELVVVGVERTHEAKESVFVDEAFEEGVVSKNSSPVSRGPTRNDRYPSVDAVCGCCFEIAPLEIEAT